MKGNPEVIAVLNEQLASEYQAIIQYVIHAQMLDNWGLSELAGYVMKESKEEMGHAERLMEQVLFLEGVPAHLTIPEVALGTIIPEMFKNDADGERAAIERLNRGIALAVSVSDNDSRKLMESILADESNHLNWVESQIFQIDQIGAVVYMAQHIKPL